MLCGQQLAGSIHPAPRNGSQEPNAVWSAKMPNIMAQGWARTPSQAPGRYALHQQEHSSSAFVGWLKIMRLWIARSEQRRTLGELAEQDERMLRDIGVSREAAQGEVAKPFWRR
jgi:uncharacterized protein YjiS (DUF1127 family)